MIFCIKKKDLFIPIKLQVVVRKCIVVLFLCNALFCFSQGEANIWYFGNHAGLDFNTGNPVVLTNGQINTPEGCATISNSNGQLLFYTDGLTVWDRNHTIMPNGTGLLGHPSSSQAAVIVPKPNSSTIYYIFTCSDWTNTFGVNYSEVDLSLNSGFGDITTNKNINLISGEVSEKLTAVKHGNGSDYWVMAHGYPNNTFYLFKVTALGVETTPVLNNIGTTISTDNDKAGYLKFSPDGSKLVAANGSSGLEIFDFNSNTGQLSNFQNISGVGTPIFWYGVEFSPSSKILYVSRIFNQVDFLILISENSLVQYDLTVSNILLSEVTLYSTFQHSLFYGIGALQLAPDGKIYIAINDNYINSHISVINNPDVLGTSCNFNVSFLDLSPGFVTLGLPQFIQSYFNASFTVQNLCLGATTQFMLNASQTPISVLWDFGDGTTSTLTNPTHQYATPGNYTVTVVVTSASGTINKDRQITISAVPTIANTISNSTLCGTANQNYDLSQFNATLLGTQPSNTYGTAYFSSMSNAVNHVNLLPVNQSLSIGETTFYAKVYNLNNTSCYAITSFTVTLSQQPIAHSLTEYIICETQPYDGVAVFDLTSKNSQLLGIQNINDYTITYHASLTQAQNGSFPLSSSYTNTSPSEILYARIQSNSNPSCYATTPLTIKVIQQPLLYPVSDFIVCDDPSNDGIAMFNLNEKTAEILNGQSNSVFQVKYYFTAIDAQNETAEIQIPILNTVNNQIIYYTITAIGNINCKAISSFKLIVTPLPIALTPNDFYICDDASNDGVAVFNLQDQNNTILGTQNPAGYTVTYYTTQINASTAVDAISLQYQNTSNPQTIYARVQSNTNPLCFATTSFKIGLFKQPIAYTPPTLSVCDDVINDGKETFDLYSQSSFVLGTQSPNDFTVTYHVSLQDANSGLNPQNLLFSNTINPQLLYVRITNNLNVNCYQTTSFILKVLSNPDLNMSDHYTICEGAALTIQAPLGFNSYYWSNGSTNNYINLTQSGNYALTVTKNYGDISCMTTKNFTVHKSNKATIEQVIIQDWTDNQNALTILVNGDGIYEYALDGWEYQSSNTFTSLDSGTYKVYVRDTKGCGITEKQVFLLMYPRVFTPNQDGNNDVWNIRFSKYEKGLEVKIFDRYGKLVTLLNNQSGWDGSYNGQKMPSDDYWFVVTRKDGKQHKGHFSLKR